MHSARQRIADDHVADILVKKSENVLLYNSRSIFGEKQENHFFWGSFSR